MNVADDADGSLDPRIQIELENLNNATDDINKLETELVEAHTAFRQLLSESTKRLKEITYKLGCSCIEKARCYYDALEEARQARVKCQQQAQLFQRASEIHAAAKETVALAEARFMSHQHEWNFDQAWQDMLNHATIKVMDAENQKAECAREHHRRAMLFHDAEKRLLQLEEKHRRSIIKARPYFEVKAHCDQMLATQKERVECLQRTIKDAKRNYATSLRALEEISNQIHQQRRDNDFVANGPREPGVGAELVSPEKSPNYEVEFNQLNNSGRMNSQLNTDSRPENYETCEWKDDSEHLGKRSVDGSEATSSQWELELQVSMENLNNLSLDKSAYGNDHENLRSSELRHYDEEINAMQEKSSANFMQSKEFPGHNLNRLNKSPMDFQVSKASLDGTSLMSHIQGLRATKTNTANSQDSNRPRGALRNYESKSLNSSPINMNASNIDGSKFAEKPEGQVAARYYVPNKILNVGYSNKKSHSNSDINLSWNLDISPVERYQNSNDGSITTNDIVDNKTDKQGINSPCTKESYITEETSEDNASDRENAASSRSRKEETLLKKRPKSNIFQVVSHSASSSPVKLKSSVTLPNARSLDKTVTNDPNTSKTSSTKELPLLSLFEKTNSLSSSKGKSSSMINLDDKQNLMLLLDHSHLNDIQTVSAERLANARDKLFPKVPR